METVKKYAPFFIVILFLITFVPNLESFNWGWLGLVGLVVVIILLFERIESTRKNRSKKWKESHPSKIKHILIFSLGFGFPISLLIYFLIQNRAELLFVIIFIFLPLIIIFGWIGFLDHRSCEKKFLENKYKVEL